MKFHLTPRRNWPRSPAKVWKCAETDGVCWSLAYKAALWTRLEDGNHAWLLVRKALFSVTTQEVGYDNGGGVYVNLFDACPPFQIDGNFGVTRSSANCCCNRNWEKSNCCLRAHGGFQVDETRSEEHTSELQSP